MSDELQSSHHVFKKKNTKEFFFKNWKFMGGSNTFFQVCTRTHACAFSLGDFSDFTKYLPTIILEKFNYAVKCKKHCNT